MKNFFMVVSVMAFGAGVAWRSLVELEWSWSIWFLLLALVVSLIWKRASISNKSSLVMVSLALVYLALGIVRTEVFSWQFNNSPLEENLNNNVELTGVVTQEPDYRANSVHLYVEVEDDLLLVTADRLGKYQYGDGVLVQGKLTVPESFATDLGRTFDYSGYLLAKGVEYKISYAKVEVLDTGAGNPIVAGLLKLKNNFISSMQQIIPEPQAGLGTGLLLGVKSGLGDDIEEDFRKTGIIHIVVLSGYNVMLVVAFIMFVFSFFLPLRWRIVAGVASIVCFALIVGLSATVVRASIMAALVLVAQVLGRRYDVLRALLLAGWVMILINPYLLVYDIGFQLSFMATLGLILIVPHFESTAMSHKGMLGWREFLLATVSTQIAVLPLLMYHIGEVSLIAVLVNLLVLPMVPAAMLLTFITGVIGWVYLPLASLIGYVANFTLGYILQIANWFGALPHASVPVPEFSAVGVLFMYVFMAGLLWFLQSKKSEKNVTTNVPTHDSLADWIIEEEFDELPNQKATALNTATSVEKEESKEEIPVFFR